MKKKRDVRRGEIRLRETERERGGGGRGLEDSKFGEDRHTDGQMEVQVKAKIKLDKTNIEFKPDSERVRM